MNSKLDLVTKNHLKHLHRAIELALEAEQCGNVPVGAVITLNDEIIAEAGNSILSPYYYPGAHAEIEALRRVPSHLWKRCHEMTCYSTLEPCVMCMGAILLHGVGHVVFGALDVEGGAGVTLHHLPPYYAEGKGVPSWNGPLLSELCDPLYNRVRQRFDVLPCGKDHKVTS